MDTKQKNQNTIRSSATGEEVVTGEVITGEVSFNIQVVIKNQDYIENRDVLGTCFRCGKIASSYFSLVNKRSGKAKVDFSCGFPCNQRWQVRFFKPIPNPKGRNQKQSIT